MDWYSWLSKSRLDPTLIYEYSLAFARNELEKEDLSHFNHEFLQSMGISVAKHRLEIIKLARKEVGGGLRSLSRFISVIKKTKKCLAKTITKWVFHKESAHVNVHEVAPYRPQWSGALRKQNSSKELKHEKVIVTDRGIMRSGPLDRRVHERMMVTSRSLSVSGPLDGNEQEKYVFMYRSPTVSGPLDGRIQDKFVFADRSPNKSCPWEGRGWSPKVRSHYSKEKMDGDDGDPSVWSMFQDMKPT